MLIDIVLLCEHCGHDYTHQFKAEVFFRFEDALEGLHVAVSQDHGVAADASQWGNPSSRRSGIRVLYYCEDCLRVSELTVVQHKGQTYLAVAKSEADAPADAQAERGQV